jgi:hypothetical protein
MTQYHQADLEGMTAQQIVAAHEAGELDTLLTGSATAPVVIAAKNPEYRLDRRDVEELRLLGHNELIDDAFTAGRIDL